MTTHHYTRLEQTRDRILNSDTGDLKQRSNTAAVASAMEFWALSPQDKAPRWFAADNATREAWVSWRLNRSSSTLTVEELVIKVTALLAKHSNTLNEAPNDGPMDCEQLDLMLTSSIPADRTKTINLLLSLNPAQLRRQAVAYAAWLAERHGVASDADTLIRNWKNLGGVA